MIGFYFSINICDGNFTNSKIFCSGYTVGGYVLCQHGDAQKPCEVSIAQNG